MTQLIIIAVLTAITLGIVSATVSFLFWRNPMLQKTAKLGIAILSVLLSLLATAGITKLYDKYVIQAAKPKKSSAIGDKGKPTFMYGYRLVEGSGNSKIIVGDKISRDDLEITLKQAARDLAAPSTAVSISAYTEGDRGDLTFVGQVSATAGGQASVDTSGGVELPGEKPTL